MNQRTLLLAAGAIAVFGLYFLDQGYRSFIEEPTRRYESRLEAIEGDLGDAKRDQVVGRRLANQLETYALRALPYQADIARSRYQDWLLQLVAKHDMQSASVDAESPRAVEVRGRVKRRQRRLVGYRIGYALRARTTLQHLTDFLYEFHQSAQLHKIGGFSLTPLVDGNQLDLSMEIETLTLEATERSDTLSQWVRADTSMPSRADYASFVQRNLFARGFSRALAQVQLTAITRGRTGEKEAWFRVGSPPRTQQVGAGQQVQIPLHQISVKGFDADAVRLEVNGLPCSITLGQSLADVFDVPVEAAPGQTSSPSDEQPNAGSDAASQEAGVSEGDSGSGAGKGEPAAAPITEAA